MGIWGVARPRSRMGSYGSGAGGAGAALGAAGYLAARSYLGKKRVAGRKRAQSYAGKTRARKRQRRPRPPGMPYGVPFPYSVPASRRLVRMRSFNTKGRYVGRFNRSRVAKPGKFVKYGALMRTEKGGSSSWDKCVYIGHSTGARTKVLRIFWFAVLRKLAWKCGLPIPSMKSKLQEEGTTVGFSPGTIKTHLKRLEGEQAIQIVSYTIPADATWETIADGVNAAIDAVIITTEATTGLLLDHITWDPNTEEASGKNLPPRGELRLKDCVMHLQVDSEMMIQNRTLATTSVEVEHQHHANSVENNPLIGKSYFKTGTEFQHRFNNDYAGNTANLYPDDNSGVISLDPDDASLTTEMQDLLQRPPMASAFVGVRHTGRVILNPGAIKRSALKYVRKMSVTQFWRKLVDVMRSGSGGNLGNFIGKSKVFAFEKMMHTDEADEPDINIGYEVNNVYRCVLFEKPCLISMDQDVL